MSETPATTLTPSFVRSGSHAAAIPRTTLGIDETFTDYASLNLSIAGTTPLVFVVWNGHQFETVNGTLFADEFGLEITHLYDPIQPAEAVTLMYFPIDPRITEADVARADIAYPNADNTGWLFAHSDHDAMIDYEHELAAATVALFAMTIDAAQVKVNEATNAVVRPQAIAAHAALTGFRNAVVGQVTRWARTLHIGWQEQNPHDAHVHAPIHTAVNDVARIWQTDRATEWTAISSRVAAILKVLAKPHAYETRWDKATRIAAEEAAAEAEAAAEDTEGE